MKTEAAVIAFNALGNPQRLAVYQLLYEAGEDGLSAGDIAEQLEIPVSSLTFHTKALLDAGLIDQRREGRMLMYSTVFGTMSALVLFLSKNFIGVRRPSTPRKRP